MNHPAIEVHCAYGHAFKTTVRRRSARCRECGCPVYVRLDGSTNNPAPTRSTGPETPAVIAAPLPDPEPRRPVEQVRPIPAQRLEPPAPPAKVAPAPGPAHDEAEGSREGLAERLGSWRAGRRSRSAAGAGSAHPYEHLGY